MKTLKIVLSPDPGLRSVCEECTVGDKSLIKLSKQMLKTMYANNGCGLAAPQVGINKRFVVIDCLDDEGNADPYVLVNPVIEWSSADSVTEEEGDAFLFQVFQFLSRVLQRSVFAITILREMNAK